MVDEKRLKSARNCFLLGIAILPLSILILIIVLSIEFGDQSNNIIVFEIDWSVYVFIIIAFGYSIISIIWYLYLRYNEGQSSVK